MHEGFPASLKAILIHPPSLQNHHIPHRPRAAQLQPGPARSEVKLPRRQVRCARVPGNTRYRICRSQYDRSILFYKPEGLDLWIAPGEARGQQFPRHLTPKGLTVNEFKI